MGDVSAIEIRGLVKTFTSFKLGPMDLTVPKGAIYGLIGPNAAGKTTTIDLILGMGREDAGTIRVFGLDHWKDEVEIKRRIGYVSPENSYAAWAKVGRLIHFIRGYYPDWDNEYCRGLLDRFGIGFDDRIRTMSFGTRVKLGVVLALSHRPDLLLLDEPTMGVDVVAKKQIFTELLAAVQSEDRTVLISSHGLTDVERFADHVGIIKDGRLLLEGPTTDMVERYRMVDFVCPNGEIRLKGLLVQERSGNRVRALVDLKDDGLGRLKAMGAVEITASPVTLEEIVVALAEEE